MFFENLMEKVVKNQTLCATGKIFYKILLEKTAKKTNFNIL